MRSFTSWRATAAYGAILGAFALYPIAFANAQTADIHLSAPEFVTPAPPDDGTKPNCKVARKYIELVAAGRGDQIIDLFADKAVHYGSDGKTRRGKDVINTYYRAMNKPSNISGSAYYQDGNRCFAFIVNGPDEAHKRLSVVDEFVVDAEGKIIRLIGFAAPAPAKQ